MEKFKLFSSNFSTIIDNIENNFTLRHNKNTDNKLNFRNTLYTSSLLLNSTSIDAVCL